MGIFHKKSQLEKKYKVDPPVLGTSYASSFYGHAPVPAAASTSMSSL